jgi:GT2 family glycosyltransferase/glycosyltransferase involved in cell wall biosynthesis
MRILLVAHTFPPASETGSEIYARDLAAVLQRRHGDRVLVLAREADGARGEYAVRTERQDGLTVVWINNTFADVRSFEDGYRNERLAAVASAAIDDFAPDVAHVHHLTCLSTEIPRALSARGIPVVLTLHDYWLMCHRGQLLDRDGCVCDGPGADGCGRCVGPEAGVAAGAWVRAALPASAYSVARRLAPLVATGRAASGEEQRRVAHMRDICSHVTRFLAPSRAIRDRFVACGIPATRIALSPYGFDRTPFRGLVRTGSHRLRLAFLGSIIPSKAPHLLLEAARRLPRGAASVDLFGAYAPYHGDDSYRARIEALTSADVRVHGAVPHREVPRALASIDVLVVPSVWPENSPLVINEAFMAGVPVVASRIGGIPEIVRHGRNGLLFDAGDVDGLTGALERLRADRALLDALSAGAAATGVRSIDDDADATRALYASLRPHDAAVVTRVAAVVLNYRAEDDTLLAVKSLLASRRPVDDVIVVDNDTSNDRGGARAALADVAAEIVYMRAPRNLGYSGGMNLGIREALRRGAGRVVLVNSDVIVPPDCIERLERAILSTPGAGIAGPLIVARSDPDIVGSSGMSYRPATGRMRHAGFGRAVDVVSPPAAAIVDGVSGCLMLVTREVFDAVGLLDEDYFFSFEDLDFCLRARRAGFSTVLAGAATAHHEGGRSIGARSPRRLYFAARGHLLLARRAGRPAGRVASACRTVAIVALNLAHAVRSGGAPLPVRLAAVARGVRDYFAGRFGPDVGAV